MTSDTTTVRGNRATVVIPFLLALALLDAGGTASAQWLEKLKNAFGGSDEKEQSLSSDEVGGGLKEALRVGTENVVGNLGKTDGFNLDPQIHIPLPGQLDRVRKVLGKIGMDSMLADLELRLNRAAEIATPKAKELFIGAINEMTLDDVMAAQPTAAYDERWGQEASWTANDFVPIVFHELGGGSLFAP